jgi:isoleucyl-tRNA synthetase
MSAGLFDSHAIENALTTGTIMAEDGTKMSKSKKNYPDPMQVIDQYGVDSLRLYFASSSIMKTAQNVNFNQEAINDIKKKTINIIWNVLSFYKLVDDQKTTYGYEETVDNIMDRWLVSTTQQVIQQVTNALDAYDVVTASKTLMNHISDLSTWYVRRSRDRLRSKNAASVQVFRTVLKDIALLLAPFAPFIAESIYQHLPNVKQDSVHLDNWPEANPALIDENIESAMIEARQVVERAHALRKECGINVRQPLAAITVTSTQNTPSDLILEVIAEELNIKQVKWLSGSELHVVLDTKLTDSLKAEGEAREIIRKIQNARKNAHTPIDHAIHVNLPTWPKEYETEIKTKVKALTLTTDATFSIQDAGIWQA